jgi:hypothetical protein
MTPDIIETIGLAISGSGVTSPASRRKARAAIAAIEAAGYVIAPKEPTPEMVEAAISRPFGTDRDDGESMYADIYSAMIAIAALKEPKSD